MGLLRIFTVAFFLTATSFTVTDAHDKNLTLEGPSGPVKVKEGSDVILPCKLQPPQDVSKKVVQWKRDSEIVHTRKKDMDDLDSQNSTFKNRTKLFPEEMDKGNISLKIFNVTKEDAGNYSCSVSMPNTKRTYIQLIVEIPQRPGGNETNKQGPGWLSNGAISGIVIGAVFLFVIITAGCWRFWKWWKARGQTQEMIQYQRNGDYVEVLQGPSEERHVQTGNTSEDQNFEVEMQELNGPRDEERNMNPHTVLCCVSED